MTLAELDAEMLAQHGAERRQDRYLLSVEECVWTYVNPRSQERLLVEVIDGRPTVYSFCRNLERRTTE